MDLAKTDRSYATRENAIKALGAVIVLDEARWLIAVKEDGRFIPVVVGAAYSHLIHHGVTVVG